MSRSHMTVISPAPSAAEPGLPASFAGEQKQVTSYQGKAAALQALEDYAKRHGLSASIRDRARRVADELMMNALYHAPTFAEGRPRDLARRANLPAIQIHFGCSGDTLVLCVRDGFGTLSRSRALQYLQRAESARIEVEDKPGGAGLGLATALKLSSELTLSLSPGAHTEVLAIFDPRSHREANSLRILGGHDALERSESLPLPPRDETVPMTGTTAIANSREPKKAVPGHAPQR